MRVRDGNGVQRLRSIIKCDGLKCMSAKRGLAHAKTGRVGGEARWVGLAGVGKRKGRDAWTRIGKAWNRKSKGRKMISKASLGLHHRIVESFYTSQFNYSLYIP